MLYRKVLPFHYPKLKRFIQAKKSDGIETIVLDMGDNCDRSHPLTEASQGKANITWMNDLGIQYATIGNNEGGGFSKKSLNALYQEADFSVIIGNLQDKGACPQWAKPYTIYQTSLGHRIAILAYTFPYYLTYEPNGWDILDPLERLKKDLERPEVKKADFRLIMSHLGRALDEQISQLTNEIDLIIGGHTHHVFEEGACIQGTYLAAAGKYGQHIGEINLTLDEGQVLEMAIRAHETSHLPSLPEDKEWSDSLYQEGMEQLAKEKIKCFSKDLTSKESADLVMTAMTAYAQADLALINSGLLVEPFSNPLTKASLLESLPHHMRLIRLELTLKELDTICQDIFSQEPLLQRQEIRGMGFRGKHFGHILTKGFAYKNGKIVYNKKVMGKSEKLSLVLVDQYYFASYFKSIKAKEPEILFPHLLRELVQDYVITNDI
ncbi:bifunctional metallophosphatase/5'-nucleotidase [Streptococcus ictaluri]|uniref:Ser/Thr protein phosphatase family protein n=1 Tax=Streptococcus ictaluri 707-05 TaxID=764299 RepID=G5K0Y9_9STRE|nr:metallophosphatase [Streptococcus ictaluri]EHI70357.1 Ser/Thr protein phosphatase family protein [Streptococcus ictaluri 707-05]